MIVKPTLLDDPKFLILEEKLGHQAIKVVLRLWSHAQLVSPNFGKVDRGFIKQVTRYRGSAEVLWMALTKPLLPGRGPWLDVDTQGNVTVHGWEEHNRGLLASRTNGVKGGRPAAKPAGNPQVKVEQEPAGNPQGGLRDHDRIGLDRIGLEGTYTRAYARAREELCRMYGRPVERQWSCLEEQTLVELVRRSGFEAELEVVKGYRSGLGAERLRYFPRSLAALLTRWNEVLDQARVDGVGEKKTDSGGGVGGGRQGGDEAEWWECGRERFQALLAGAKLNGDEALFARLRQIGKERGF